jgi:pimeloyl-ACP methyl ester carboxylesterase
MKHLTLLHGALGSKAQMAPLAAALNGAFHVHVLDFSGHGGREIPDALSMDVFVQDVLSFLDVEGIEQTHFFGYSMGGYVALKLAAAHPARVGRIMTFATKYDWTPDGAAREARMLDPEKIEEKVPKFAHMLQARHLPADWKTLCRRTADLMIALGNGAAFQPGELKLSHPALITVGDQDNMVTIAESEVMAGSLANGHFELLNGFTHLMEQADVQLLAGKASVFFKREG